jgi:hypothetical protein
MRMPATASLCTACVAGETAFMSSCCCVRPFIMLMSLIALMRAYRELGSGGGGGLS